MRKPSSIKRSTSWRGAATLETIMIFPPLLFFLYATGYVHDFWRNEIEPEIRQHELLFQQTTSELWWVDGYPDNTPPWTNRGRLKTSKVNVSNDDGNGLPLYWLVSEDILPAETLRGSCTWCSFPWLRSQFNTEQEGRRVIDWYQGLDAHQKLAEARDGLKLGT